MDWLNMWLSIPIALAGFGLTYWQARKARTAAEAAKTAADSAKNQFRLVSAASLLPQLSQLEEAVVVAARTKSPEMLTHVLGSWLWQAALCRGYLDSTRPEEDAVMKKLQKSITTASTLKVAAASFDGNTDWHLTTEPARKSIADVTQRLGTIAAQQAVRTEDDPDGT
jgi:hypothetical protein